MFGYTLPRRDYWLFACIFYTCYFIGALPLTRKRINGKELFIVSGKGKILCLGHIGLTLLIMCFLFVVKSTMFDLSGLFTIQSFICSAATLLISLLCKPNELASCFNSAYQVYLIPHQKFTPISVPRSITMITLPFIALLYLVQLFSLKYLMYFLILFSVNYLYAYVTAVEVVISLLCWIAKRSFTFINKCLLDLYSAEFDVLSFISVKHLLEKHFLVSKFVRETSQYFGLHFLNTFIFFFTKTILFFPRFKTLNETYVLTYVMFYMNLSYMVVRMLLLCYNCERLYVEMGETVDILGRIRVRWMHILTQEQADLLDTYEELLGASQVEFTACGFFKVNIQQLLSVLGLIVTYGVIALQTK